MFGLRTLSSTLFAALALSAGALASPVATPLPTAAAAAPTSIKPNEFDVYTPPILSPSASTVWHTGDSQIVTWDTSSLDAEGKNTSGYLLLGYLENNSENLDTKHPLAHGFLLGDGQTNVTVPNVITRSDYIVVLLGDSGNTSPAFTIQNTAAQAASSALTSAAAVATAAASTTA